MNKKKNVDWTNPDTDEKFIHTENQNGNKELLYGPKDSAEEKKHGHAVFDKWGNVVYNRKPKYE